MVTRHSTVLDAAKEMLKNRTTSIAILDKFSRPCGLVSEMDIINGFMDGRATVGDIMTPWPLTVYGGAPRRQKLEYMLRNGFRHLPEIGWNGEYLSTSTICDLCQESAETKTQAIVGMFSAFGALFGGSGAKAAADATLTVSDLMSGGEAAFGQDGLHFAPGRRLHCMQTTTQTVADAIVVMRDSSLRAVLVEEPVAAPGKIAGIFTAKDVVTKVIAKGLPNTTALADVMTPAKKPDGSQLIQWKRPNTPLSECLALMVKFHFRHLPIVNEKGKVVAVIDLHDTTRALFDANHGPSGGAKRLGRSGSIDAAAPPPIPARAAAAPASVATAAAVAAPAEISEVWDRLSKKGDLAMMEHDFSSAVNSYGKALIKLRLRNTGAESPVAKHSADLATIRALSRRAMCFLMRAGTHDDQDGRDLDTALTDMTEFGKLIDPLIKSAKEGGRSQEEKVLVSKRDENRVDMAGILVQQQLFMRAVDKLVLVPLEKRDEGWRAVCAQIIQAAKDLKEMGKERCGSGEWEIAFGAYTIALQAAAQIQRDELELFNDAIGAYTAGTKSWTRRYTAVLFANRATCTIKLGSKLREGAADTAVEDCKLAIEAEPTYAKAWLRYCERLDATGRTSECSKVVAKAKEALAGCAGADAKILTTIIATFSSCDGGENAPLGANAEPAAVPLTGMALMLANIEAKKAAAAAATAAAAAPLTGMALMLANIEAKKAAASAAAPAHI